MLSNNNKLNPTESLITNSPCFEHTNSTEQVVFNNKKTEASVANKSLFANSGVIFPHEDTIAKTLEMIKKYYSMGRLSEDKRKTYIPNADASKTIKFNHNLSIFTPFPSCIVDITKHYKQKYNINISYIDHNIKNNLYTLAQQVKNEEQIGVIASLYECRHVTPLIFSKRKDTLYIVALDSLSIKVIDVSQNLLEELCIDLTTTDNAKNCHLLYAGAVRQVDDGSCVNDAIVILKDALREPNLIENLLKNITADTTNSNGNEAQYKINTAKFPKFLYKTVQNKQLLNELTSEDLQTPLKTSGSATKTLATHLEKYNRTIVATIETYSYDSHTTTTHEKNWEVNTYLLTKGYRLLLNAFNIIDDGNGNINTEKAKHLESEYVNPQSLIKHRIMP